MRSKAHPRRLPERTCILCGRKAGKAAFVRLSTTPAGVRLGPAGDAQGRGAYLCRRPECDETLLRARKLSYALRTQVSETEVRRLIAELSEKAVPRGPAETS